VTGLTRRQVPARHPHALVEVDPPPSLLPWIESPKAQPTYPATSVMPIARWPTSEPPLKCPLACSPPWRMSRRDLLAESGSLSLRGRDLPQVNVSVHPEQPCPRPPLPLLAPVLLVAGPYSSSCRLRCDVRPWPGALTATVVQGFLARVPGCVYSPRAGRTAHGRSRGFGILGVRSSALSWLLDSRFQTPPLYRRQAQSEFEPQVCRKPTLATTAKGQPPVAAR
jgi:hypothetical protein